MQVAKWGNSLAVRLPAALVEALGLKEGDDIEIRAADRAHFDVHRAPTREEIVAKLDSLKGLLPKDFKFNRDEANER